ncbi:epoxide hydrolase family protein [Streptomyces sp. NPDC048603]|uniref:epoxide hydrolase family protein n=1 Tax=Streptomyces sp. NPDC048603 TaxID=3365577 RepID=UPI0037175914
MPAYDEDTGTTGAGASATTGTETIRPFRIEIEDSALEDLRDRLARTRWPADAPGEGWAYGIPVAEVRRLAEYWRDGYDWRAHEARLNGFPQSVTEIDGTDVHFLHVRSPEPDALPLVLTHGWPGSFAEFADMIGPLSDPRAHGGDPADAFHVVVPSIPGYAFSGPTRDRGWSSRRIAAAWDELMRRLGYDRYGAHGGDAGSLVGRQLGLLKPKGLVGTHVLQLFSFPSGAPGEMESLTAEDHARLAVLADFQEKAGFSAIQSTRPQTLAYALTDSPVGQLAWNELLLGMGAPNGLTDDQILTHVTLYWLTGTAGSAARQYYEDAHDPEPIAGPNTAPTGVAVFAGDFLSIRPFAERDNTDILQWSEYDRGGHFAAMEVPDVLTEDIRGFFRRLR